MLRHIIHDTAKSYQSLQVFRLGSAVLLTIVLVQVQFSSSQIGDFEWFLFISNVASFFWGLGLKNAFMSFFPKASLLEQRKLLFNLGVLFFGLGILAFAVLYWLEMPRMDALYVYLPYLALFLILGTVASISEHVLIVHQKAKELFLYGVFSYASYFLGLSVLAVGYQSIQMLLIGLAAWAVFRFIYFVVLVFRYGKIQWDGKLIKRFVWFGWPLIIHVLLGGGMEYVDGYLVEAYFDRSNFTYFRYGARELPINTIFISAIASSFIPQAVLHLTDSLEEIKRRVSRLMHILFPLSMVLMLVSPAIFTFVYSEEYRSSAFIFNIYLLIICSRILLPQIVLYAKQHNSFLMLVSVVEFGINIGLSLFLMNIYGIYGIAFATPIAFLIQKILLLMYNKRTFDIPVSAYINVPRYLLFSIGLYLVFFLSLFFYK